MVTLVDDDTTIDIANTPGIALPSTGGIGTTLFYILGSVLILGAVIMLFVLKRNRI